jgi:hypothetical protein
MPQAHPAQQMPVQHNIGAAQVNHGLAGPGL